MLAIDPGIDLVSRMDAGSIQGLIQEFMNYMSQNVTETEFSAFKFADGTLIDEDPARQPGVSSVSRTRLTRLGAWNWATGRSTIGNEIDYGTENVTYGAEYIEATISWTTQELQRMAYARQIGRLPNALDVPATKRRMVAEAYQEMMNKVNATGKPSANIYGLLNHPDVPELTLATRPGLAQSADTNISILNSISYRVSVNTKQKARPSKLLMPKDIVNDLSLQQRTTAGNKSTLKSYLDDNQDGVNAIETVLELDTAGPGNKSVIYLYEKNPDYVVYMSPQPMMPNGPLTFNKGKWTQEYIAQVAGVHIMRPTYFIRAICP
jgi:hypothetical protein